MFRRMAVVGAPRPGTADIFCAPATKRTRAAGLNQ